MSGKGSKQRPMKVDRVTFEQNWDLIFGDESQKSNPIEPQEEKLSQETTSISSQEN